MIETVNVLKKGYEKALSYIRQERTGILSHKEEKIAEGDRDGLYIVHEESTSTIGKKALPAETCAQNSSALSIASSLVDHYKESGA